MQRNFHVVELLDLNRDECSIGFIKSLSQYLVVMERSSLGDHLLQSSSYHLPTDAVDAADQRQHTGWMLPRVRSEIHGHGVPRWNLSDLGAGFPGLRWDHFGLRNVSRSWTCCSCAVAKLKKVSNTDSFPVGSRSHVYRFLPETEFVWACRTNLQRAFLFPHCFCRKIVTESCDPWLLSNYSTVLWVWPWNCEVVSRFDKFELFCYQRGFVMI